MLSAGAWTQTMMKAMKALLPAHTSVEYGSRLWKCTWHTLTLTMCRCFADLVSVPLRRFGRCSSKRFAATGQSLDGL